LKAFPTTSIDTLFNRCFKGSREPSTTGKHISGIGEISTTSIFGWCKSFASSPGVL